MGGREAWSVSTAGPTHRQPEEQGRDLCLGYLTSEALQAFKPSVS